MLFRECKPSCLKCISSYYANCHFRRTPLQILPSTALPRKTLGLRRTSLRLRLWLRSPGEHWDFAGRAASARFPPSGTMRHDFAVTPTLSRATWKWMVSRLGADAKISHEFTLRARCHELARIFLLPFVKIRVIRGRKLRSALERETTWKCDG